MAKKKPIVSKEGQWKYPGQETIIPNANGRITMQGVPYPVLGIDDLGNQQMMMPGAEYQFPGNSVYEIPMAKNGGTKRVKINSLPKAQNGEEVIWTAGTHELWEPLPEMTPEESNQWMSLRGDAIPITGNFATNAQIYATYKRAKEMGLGYDEYMGKEMAKAQQRRESIVPKPIPGLPYTTGQLKELSELPGSPFMYNAGTGDYYLPGTEAFKISDPAKRTDPYDRPMWEASFQPELDAKFYSEFYNDRLETAIEDINDPLKNFKPTPGTNITPDYIEEQRQKAIEIFESNYNVKYDPTVDYRITPQEAKQNLFIGPGNQGPINQQAFHNSIGRIGNGYQELMGQIPEYRYGFEPEEKYDIIRTRERDKQIKSELDQPLAKFLGADGDNVNPNIIKRSDAMASDKVAEQALMDFNKIVAPRLGVGNIFSGDAKAASAYNPLDVANTEHFRSFMNMDPKALEAIAASPFGSGDITLTNNDNAKGTIVNITKKEAKELLAIRNAIAGSDMWSYLNEPTPVDAMIQGTANTLSWMAGNENAEGPGTLGELAHGVTGYQAQNKGLDLLSTISGIGDIGGNLLTNTWNGVRTDVPTYKSKPLFHSYTDPTTANVYQGLFDMVNDPVGLITGSKTASTLLNVAGDWTRGANRASSLNKFLVRGNTAGTGIGNNLNFSGLDIPSLNYTPEEVFDNKARLFSPFSIKKYSKNPKTGRSVLESRNIHNFNGPMRTEPVVTDAKYWNNLTGRNDIEVGDLISTEDAKLHITNVFDAKKPKPSKEKFRGVTFDEFKVLPFSDGINNVKIPRKWTADELESHIGYVLDSKQAPRDLLKGSTGVRLSGGDSAARGIGYATAGLLGIGALGLNKRDYIDPYVDKYLPALANKLGLNDLEVDKNQVTIELSEEGGKLSAARVNDTDVDGNVILGGEFIFNNPNTVNSIKWFKENPTASLGDPSLDYGEITTETAPGFWGLEDGKLKAGALSDFSDETIVVPIRPSTNAFKPIRQAGVAEDGGLRMITDPDQENDGLVFNNARTQGKLLFYSPKTGRSYYVYNNNPQSTAAEVNRLISENEDLRYIMLDNGRYSHYKDKGTEKLTPEDLKEYAAGDIGKEGNPGYNIIFKRKDSKKFGGAINFRDGGQLPKAQFGPPTASDSAMVASRASQVGDYLINNGYNRLNTKPATFANPAAFRQDLESGIRRFTNANNSGNIIDFRTGNRGSFPGNYTVGYTGHNPVWSQRDMASGVLNPNIPPSYYDTRILPQKFETFDASNQYGNYDSVGKYTYEKLAVTPWKKLTTKQKIQRLERYGTSGSPYKDVKTGLKELKSQSQSGNTKRIAEKEMTKLEPKDMTPIKDKNSGIEIQPQLGRKPIKSDKLFRTPMHTANNGVVIRVHDKDQRFVGWEDEDGNPINIENPTGSPTSDFDPIYKPKIVKVPKFQRGGDISIPDLKRVKIHNLPKAQGGTQVNSTISNINNMFNLDNVGASVDMSALFDNPMGYVKSNIIDPSTPYTIPDEYYSMLKIQENSKKKGYRDGRYYDYASPEGGSNTIGYGHKLTDEDVKLGKFKKGLTEQEVDSLFHKDVDEHLQRAKQRYDNIYGTGAFSKLNPQLKTLALDFTYNGIDLSDKENGYPKFWSAANEYSTAKDDALKQQAYQIMLKNYVRNVRSKETGKLIPLGERNKYTLGVLNNMKKNGGQLPKAQYGPPDWREFITRKMTPTQNLVGDVRKVNMQPTVAESTRPANMPKAPTEWKGKSGKKIIEEAKAQEAYNALPEELKRRDELSADTRSDAEKFARRAWTAVSQPMETIAAVNRGYDIPSGYMGMHDAYEGYNVGSPMTSVVDMVAGTPGFIGNAFYRQGEQIVDDPLEYALTNTLGLFDPDTRDKAIANYLDLTAVIPATRVAAGPLARGIKSAKQSFIYNAVDPVGYGMGQKILMAPETLYKNVMTPDARPKRVGNLLIPGTADPSASAIEQLGKNRLDAWAKYLGTKEKYGVFQPNYEGQFTFNAPVSPLKFASLYNDILAAKIKNSGSGFYFKEDLVDLTKKFNRAIHGDPEASRLQYKLNTFLDEQGMVKPWEQTRKTGKSDVEGFDDIVFDYDENAVMGGHHYKVTKTPEGYLHFQANDTWDLHPFERRGNANVFDDDFTKKMREQHYVKSLRNLEMGKLIGGKPFDIKVNYLVDPRTFKTIKTWRDGGELPKAQNGLDWEGVTNLELARRARAAGWDNVDQYRNANWGYNTIKQKQQELINNPEAQKFAKPVENKDQIYSNDTSPAQKAVNQAYYTLSNPLDALGNYSKYGYVPQGNIGNYGYKDDSAGPISLANTTFNPFAWGNAAYRFANEVDDADSWTTGRGAINTTTDFLEALPFFSEVSKIAKPALTFAANTGSNLVDDVVNTSVNAYNKVATGNSFIPRAWKVERPNFAIKSSDYIPKTYTDAQAAILDKYGRGMSRLTPEEWAQMEDLTRSGATDFSKADYPISRVLGYYKSLSPESEAIQGLKVGDIFNTPVEKSIRTWSVGTPGGTAPEAFSGNTRLVIPSRYTKGLGNNFAGMPYADKRIPFIWDPEKGINRFAVGEKEIMGNIPKGFKVIGSSKEDGYKNLIIKPLKKQGGQLAKAQEGLPKDYQNFLQYSETAPDNRRPDAEWQYGNPRQYDHYGMWDALGKPENFDQALEMNPHWQPDPYDGSYHGFSTNPNTGVWLKSHIPGESHPGDTGWMEYQGFMLSNDRNWNSKNQNLVYDPDLQRMRYVDRKKQGGSIKRVKINTLPKSWKNK